MSKMATIDCAVRLQLASDNKRQPQDYKEVLGEAPAALPANPPHYYGYNATTMPVFLINVANRLKLDSPSLTCAWTRLDVDKCLAATLLVFEAYIGAETTS